MEGLANKALNTMVSSYVGQVPSLFNSFKNTVVQYAHCVQHILANQNVTVNAISVKSAVVHTSSGLEN